MPSRADRNRNPAAITVAVAKQAGLVEGMDYEYGDAFASYLGPQPVPDSLTTAKFLGDPIATTIRVIDQIGYYTKGGAQRWTYIALPKFVWAELDANLKKQVVGFHYAHEGGTEMAGLFT